MSFLGKVSAFGISLLIGLSFSLPSTHAQDGVTYLGDVCWTFKKENLILQLGVIMYGAGHFPVHGKLFYSDGSEDFIHLYHGNAEINQFSGELEISLTGSEVDPELSIGNLHLILILPELEGTVYSTSDQHPIALTACP